MSQLKAAIVGLGAIYPMHAKALNSLEIPITAVCDSNVSLANKVAEELNAKAFTNVTNMLSEGNFDVLHICLPHYLHAPVSIEAMSGGYHVLTEKPMATTVEDAEKMITAAKNYNVYLGVIFQNRYNPGAILVKETLENGELGAVKGGFIHVTWNRGHDYYANSDWRGKWATEGGGALINQSIHSFDLMNHFLGNPTSVVASISNRAHPSIEVEDVAEGVITYGDTPVSFYVNTIHPYNAPVRVEVVCENGKASLVGKEAEITFNDGRKKCTIPNKEAQQPGTKNYWGMSHVKQIQDFYASLKNNSLLAIDGEQGLRTQRLVNGIYKSAKTGSKVVW